VDPIISLKTLPYPPPDPESSEDQMQESRNKKIDKYRLAA
jgi:hypothetical protein